VFLAISAMLARYFSVANVERADNLALIEAEASGNVNGMFGQLSASCRASPSCAATVRADANNPRLRRPGAVKILSLKSVTEGSPTAVTGHTRVAWTVIGQLPVVQCVDVRLTGNFFKGIKVTLLSLSAPIPNEGNC
jgi:hypothetical protein